MKKDFGVAVLISGRGSNLKALIAKAKSYEIIAVLSDNPEAPGFEYGRAADIPCYQFARRDFSSLPALKDAMREQCLQIKPDLIALAGFMLVVPPDFVKAYSGRIVNIHPALLPKYPGLHTHQRALQACESIHGCTVHFVDSGVDTGPIVAQASCPCLRTDSEDTLAARVLTFEHQLYPWAVNKIAEGHVRWSGNGVEYDETAAREAKEMGFVLPGR
jgi:phosphoribosylglycinamide formyltransferase 1